MLAFPIVLFNLFINDSVLFLTDFVLSNYTEDYNLDSKGKDRDIIKNLLRKDFRALTMVFRKLHGIKPNKISLRVH